MCALLRRDGGDIKGPGIEGALGVLTLPLHDAVPVTEQNPSLDGQGISRHIPRNTTVILLYLVSAPSFSILVGSARFQPSYRR